MKQSKPFSANALRMSVSLALAAGLTATGMPAAVAQDQDAAATEGRIEVTGSRIRQIDLETAQPIHTITRADIDRQGFTSIGEILENITAMGTPPLSRASPLSAGTVPGGTFLSLRNLGSTRTLILLNGQRLGVSIGGSADISIIPVVAVERIEVLKDGASSIYGSDAIAGVVNIITRSGYDGMRANVMYGEQSEGDQETERADFVMGYTGNRGSITTAFEYFKEGPVFYRDRPFSAFPQSHLFPNAGWTVVGQVGGFSDPITGFKDNFTRWVCVEGCDWRDLSQWVPQSFNPLDGHMSNFNEQMSLRSRRETRTVYVDGSYDITDDVRFRSQMMYSYREDWSVIAGYPFQSGAGMFLQAHELHEDSYFNPAGTWHGFQSPQPLGAFLGSIWRRGWEQPREQERQMDSLRFSATLDGVLDIADRFIEWDFSYLRNNNRVVSIGLGDFNTENIRAAFGPSFLDPGTGLVTCGTPANPIPRHSGPGGCIPWNPFINEGVEEDGGLTNNQDLHEFLFQQTHDLSDNTTQVFTFNLTGPIMPLPAGDMYFAAGVEHRKETGSTTPDPLKVTGVSSTLATRPTRGAYSVAEIYGELLIPLLSGVQGAEELNLTVATRHSDYDTFGTTTNSKVGITWKPMDELMVRSTWAEGFRAPSISDLFFGGSQTFSFYTDPCDTNFGAAATNPDVAARCQAGVAGIAGTPANFRQPMQGFADADVAGQQTPVPFLSGPNPNLEPEESESFTLGVVYSPEMVPGLTVLADYWRVKIDNTIVGDSPTQILNDCYVDNIVSRCANFTRDPNHPTHAGFVNTMAFGGRNAGFIDVKGVDLDLAYRFTTDQYGTFNIVMNNTYTYDLRFRSTNDEDVIPNHSVGFGGNFRLRTNINTGWEYGDYGVNWTIRYHGSMRETCAARGGFTIDELCSHPEFQRDWRLGGDPAPVNKVGSTTFNDLQFRWSAPWDGLVVVGANNVFDRHGPVMFTQPSSQTSYYGGFDIGRFWYVRYQQDF